MIVRELRDSACGPDGVPYSAWQHASDHAIQVLYHLYCSLFTDDEVSDDFNHVWLILLAKGDHDDDKDFVGRAACDTRPVSLANSDSKICEIALGKPLTGAAEEHTSVEQPGFLSGRILVDNIIEVETHTAGYSAAWRKQRELFQQCYSLISL